jgi:hypothetical protein
MQYKPKRLKATLGIVNSVNPFFVWKALHNKTYELYIAISLNFTYILDSTKDAYIKHLISQSNLENKCVPSSV